ncbi:Card1-like endonuclease domain-containing protein [Oceanirhabdus sp. W0125-5]|uniref:Card1-like endonuclease domain-containing protein n=1 Tax=Oceanirhabdus sp. W0125-5 TaxID=2999116 RepID=UPI0022F2EC63|nr:DUF1887 family CARF protein [Oceanirhabdus sp. W0125-5]WBW97439.1 DUF1887 family CARF protein [Oceanirhabdus sp. W0125-5]
MGYKNLVCIMNNRNYGSVVSMLFFQPENIIFITNEDDNSNNYEQISKFIENNYGHIHCSKRCVKKINNNYLGNVLKDFNREDTIISLFGDETKAVLMVYIKARELGLKCVYIDNKEDTILFIDEDKEVSISEIDIDIHDFIGINGGEILDENTKMFDEARFINMSKFILDNRREWQTFKKIASNYEIINWDKERLNIVQFRINKLDHSENSILMMFLKELENNSIGKVSSRDEDLITFKFKNNSCKDFIGKVGTWLEVLTYQAIKELGFIDDARAGVVFLWDRKEEDVKNEVDVLASYSSNLVYISCKDTAHYDSDTLNELEVYAKKIGGKTVKKILVATKESYKSTTGDRANEMGINLIIFNNDFDEFKKKLKEVIE